MKICNRFHRGYFHVSKGDTKRNSCRVSGSTSFSAPGGFLTSLPAINQCCAPRKGGFLFGFRLFRSRFACHTGQESTTAQILTQRGRTAVFQSSRTSLRTLEARLMTEQIARVRLFSRNCSSPLFSRARARVRLCVCARVCNAPHDNRVAELMKLGEFHSDINARLRNKIRIKIHINVPSRCATRINRK